MDYCYVSGTEFLGKEVQAMAEIKIEEGPSLVDQIVQDIVLGNYGPGEWLKQTDLEKRYGAKRLAVRQALAQLASKRLVKHLPNQGYRVYALDLKQQKEIRAVRTLLECDAAQDIVNNACKQDVSGLLALAETFEHVRLFDTVLEQSRSNADFHEKLISLCSNSILVEIIMDMRKRGIAAPVFRWRTSAQMEKSSKDHFMIVEAVRRKDVKRLKILISCHINEVQPPPEIPVQDD